MLHDLDRHKFGVWYSFNSESGIKPGLEGARPSPSSGVVFAEVVKTNNRAFKFIAQAVDEIR